MRTVTLAFVIAACLSACYAVPSVTRSRHGGGKGEASVVVRPEDLLAAKSTPSSPAKLDQKALDDSKLAKRGRELPDIKSPEDIRKFAHVLHGLEELFKNSDIKSLIMSGQIPEKKPKENCDHICCTTPPEKELSVTPPVEILTQLEVVPEREISVTPPVDILEPSSSTSKRERDEDQEAPIAPERAVKGVEYSQELTRNDLSSRLSSRTSPDDLESNDVEQKVRKRYDPTWDSVDSRPLPGWYDEAKFGIFIHWGVYSVPSVGTEWFWWNWQGAERPSYKEYMSQNFKPNFTYADFAPQFTAEFFNASEWAALFHSSGAKYVVLTSKHHEGFTNWPSPYSFNWNSVDVGPNRDLVGELAEAVRNQSDVKFGLYYSLFEWFNPLYLKDKKEDFKTRDYVVNKMTPELKGLIETYKPEIVWSDGDWEPQYTYWDSPGFLAWLYNDSPVRDTVVVNDRWGSEMACKHGGYYTCSDRYNPGTLQPHKWENCWTIDKKSWGYRRNAHIWEYCSIEELVQVLAETVACGGNLLLNVGPAHDGTIKPIFEERLLQMGAWLKINGDAIYKSSPWIHQNDTLVPGVWYTMRQFEDGSEKVYGIVLNWPAEGKLVLGAPKFCSNTVVNLLGWPDRLPWTASTEGPEIVFPPRQSVGSDWGWVLAFQGLCNQ